MLILSKGASACCCGDFVVDGFPSATCFVDDVDDEPVSLDLISFRVPRIGDVDSEDDDDDDDDDGDDGDDEIDFGSVETEVVLEVELERRGLVSSALLALLVLVLLPLLSLLSLLLLP